MEMGMTIRAKDFQMRFANTKIPRKRNRPLCLINEKISARSALFPLFLVFTTSAEASRLNSQQIEALSIDVFHATRRHREPRGIIQALSDRNQISRDVCKKLTESGYAEWKCERLKNNN